VCGLGSRIADGAGDDSGNRREVLRAELRRAVGECGDPVVQQPDRLGGRARQAEQPGGHRLVHALGELGDLAEHRAGQRAGVAQLVRSHARDSAQPCTGLASMQWRVAPDNCGGKLDGDKPHRRYR
jgi:hypothetical protein